MYYELYIDVFFLENFMMDSILLFLVNRFLKCGRSFGRLTAGAAAGSFLTCAVVMLPLPGAVKMILYHSAAGSVMLILGLKPGSIAQFAKAYVLLYVCAVSLGGITVIFRPYMRFACIFYAVAAAAGLVTLKCWKLIACLHGEEAVFFPVSLYTDEGMLEITALLDTGNRLRDPVSGAPVSVLVGEAAAHLPGMPELSESARLISCRSVGGASAIKVIRIRRMCIHMKEDKWIERPMLGIGGKSLCVNERYAMILNPAVIME